MKRRTEEAQLFNTELVQAADQGKISTAVSQQISLLGSRRLYERINKNLKISKFEAHFAKVKLPSEGRQFVEISFVPGAVRVVQLERGIFPQSVSRGQLVH